MKFSHAEAQAMRARGLSFGQIAYRLGVSRKAVWWACNPEKAAENKARVMARYRERRGLAA